MAQGSRKESKRQQQQRRGESPCLTLTNLRVCCLRGRLASLLANCECVHTRACRGRPAQGAAHVRTGLVHGHHDSALLAAQHRARASLRGDGRKPGPPPQLGDAEPRHVELMCRANGEGGRFERVQRDWGAIRSIRVAECSLKECTRPEDVGPAQRSGIAVFQRGKFAQGAGGYK
eukprot:1193782-Prorocentrum_minimum.AAC.1